MKETISVNLASQAFTFDKDAYRRLKEYLDAIRRRLPAGDSQRCGSPTGRDFPVQDFIADDGRYPSDGAGGDGANGRSFGIRRAADRGEARRGVRGCGECLVRQFPALVPFADESFDRRRVRRNR